jgi:glycosyltransferase involved in cell wall biosynthesis
MTARIWAARHGLQFTTSYHTRFPEYLAARIPMSLAAGYAIERWFHRDAVHTLVGTQTLMRELRETGVGRRVVHWPRGVDAELFNPACRNVGLYPFPRPIWLYVGRVAVEKSLEDFLQLKLPGTKVVVGDGPLRPELERRHADTVWRGWRHGSDLAAHFASADCFVFPSRTESFGNVLLEAMASGLPIAAVPAPGPLDLIVPGLNGVLDDNLRRACVAALQCAPAAARRLAETYSWRHSHEQFQRHLVPLRPASCPSEPGITAAVRLRPVQA